MKLSVALSTACAAVASATEYGGTVYTFGSSDNSASPPSISTSNARLLLAHRLGLAAYHSVGNADATTLELIARSYSSSSSQHSLFSAQNKNIDGGRKSLFLINGDPDAELLGGLDHQRYEAVAHVDDKSSSTTVSRFVQSFIRLGEQARATEKTCAFGLKADSRSSWISGQTIAVDKHGACDQDFFRSDDAPTSSRDLVPALLSSMSSTRHADMLDVYYIDLSSADNVGEASDMTRELLRTAAQDQPSNHQITVVTLSSRGADTPNPQAWGVKPRKRSIDDIDVEEILAMFPSEASSSLKKPALGLADAQANHSKVPVRATQPRCARSMDECVANTNNCSGHGACRLWSSNQERPCYSCACSSTKESWGKQSWGGPACQKRDISTPFWLFAGFGVVMTATVTWGIGLLYSMGESKMPSVLSAGVPPTTKK